MAKDEIDATGVIEFMRKDEVDDSCPKCGNPDDFDRKFIQAGWTLNKEARILEHLVITCNVCGFSMRVPCLDCEDPDAAMGCDFVEDVKK